MGVELAAVEGMLDEIDESLSCNRDKNGYALGRMGVHNVVVAVMPEIRLSKMGEDGIAKEGLVHSKMLLETISETSFISLLVGEQ
jgi:hypothetical protein